MGFWRQITIVLSLQLKHTENTLLEKFNHFNPLPKKHFPPKKYKTQNLKLKHAQKINTIVSFPENS